MTTDAITGDATPMPKHECPLSVLAAISPFADELSAGDITDAIARLEAMTPLDAVRLVLAATKRDDSPIGDDELNDLAEALGVFDENDDCDSAGNGLNRIRDDERIEE